MVRVDEDFVTVSQALRDADWVEFTRRSKPVFVNSRNVWWVEEQSSERSASF